MRHWIFSCKKITALISESMDRRLPLYRRLGIKLHLMMCYLCRRYEKQLLFIRSILQTEDRVDEINCASLSPEAKEKIKKKLKKKLEEEQQ